MIWYLNADTGDDTAGDGSSGSPWLTLAKAHTEATTEDTIICQDSTATYSFVSQTFTKNLTIQGEQSDASGAVFDGGGGAVKWTFHDNGSVTLEKCTFQNAKTASGQTLFSLGDSAGNTFAFTMANCIFKDIIMLASANNQSGIVGTSGNAAGSQVIAIANSLFHHCSKENTTYPAAYIAVKWGMTSGSITVTNCTIYGNQTDSNLSIDHFNGTGTSSGAGDAEVTLKNNIFQHTGIALDMDNSSVFITETVDYNCFNGTINNPAGTGNITSDPLFVDVANENFNLRPSSPCLNTGTLL